jgi:hypothetical protein
LWFLSRVFILSEMVDIRGHVSGKRYLLIRDNGCGCPRWILFIILKHGDVI